MWRCINTNLHEPSLTNFKPANASAARPFPPNPLLRQTATWFAMATMPSSAAQAGASAPTRTSPTLLRPRLPHPQSPVGHTQVAIWTKAIPAPYPTQAPSPAASRLRTAPPSAMASTSSAPNTRLNAIVDIPSTPRPSPSQRLTATWHARATILRSVVGAGGLLCTSQRRRRPPRLSRQRWRGIRVWDVGRTMWTAGP